MPALGQMQTRQYPILRRFFLHLEGANFESNYQIPRLPLGNRLGSYSRPPSRRSLTLVADSLTHPRTQKWAVADEAITEFGVGDLPEFGLLFAHRYPFSKLIE